MRTPPNDRLTFEQRKASSRSGGGAGEGAFAPGMDASAPRSAAAGKPSERRCILTKRAGRRDEMIRLALSPTGEVAPDLHERAPGRGAWITADRPMLETAIADGQLRGGLARAFKAGTLVIPDELPELVEAGLERSLLDRLGLELRCGNLLLGTQRIDKAAREGRVTALYHARDASADGSAKLDQAWRVGTMREGSGQTGTDLPLDRSALSVALGRENVVHLALLDAGAADRVARAVGRMVRYVGAKAAAPTAPQAKIDGEGDAQRIDADMEYVKE